MRCPCGHHIPRTQVFTEAGFVRCGAWMADEQRECGRWLWAMVVRGGGCLLVEVDLREIDRLLELVTPAAMLAELGVLAG